MGTRIYLAHHSGEALDNAISLVNNHGLENLEHDRGMYGAANELPGNAKEGDFAYVGTNYSSMTLYRYHRGWKSSGTTINMYSRSPFDAIASDDTRDYKDVF